MIDMVKAVGEVLDGASVKLAAREAGRCGALFIVRLVHSGEITKCCIRVGGV